MKLLGAIRRRPSSLAVFSPFEPQRLDPGVELLGRQFLFKTLQTGFPETGH
jgi:hypothetical protein